MSKKTNTGCCGGCAALFLILALTVAVRWTTGSSAPNLIVPRKPVGPSPNAFDTYRSAAQLLVNSSQVGDAVGTKPTVSRTLAQKEALVKSNAAALSMLRSGLSQDYYDTSIRSINTQFPYYAKFRALARLLSLEASVRAQEGDWNGAVQSSLDCMRLGVEIPRGGVLIGDLVGIACQSIGRKNMWNYINHLDARQSRAAIKQLLAIAKRRVPYADALQEERYIQLSALNLLFKSPNGMQGFFGPQDGGPPPAVYHLMYLVYSKQTIANNNKKYMDQLIADSRRPYALHLADPPTPSDPINKILMPVFAQARLKDVEAETQNGLICVTIALHAYRLEHGRYPDFLAQLSPSYLPTLPDDPFALKGPFKYKPVGSAYTLYSLGPDAVDDGGKPIDDITKSTGGNPNARYFIDAGSKGDIVAGKNIW